MLSNGRVSVGVGRGYQSVEFDAFGVPLDEARSRTDEALLIMKRLWTEGTVAHAGRHWNFDEVRLQPRPVQQPHPPLYYASTNDASIAHYGAQGVPFIVDSTVRTSHLPELVATWRTAAATAGHETTHADLVAVRYIWIADSDEDAKAYVDGTPRVTSLATDDRLHPKRADGTYAAGYEHWSQGWHGRGLGHYDHESDWHNRWVAGTPDRVISQLRDLQVMGIRDVCCVFGLEATPPPIGEVERRMRRFARDVMPYVTDGTHHRPSAT